MSKLQSLIAGAVMAAALVLPMTVQARRVTIDQINFIDTQDEMAYDLPFQINTGSGLSSKVFLRIDGLNFLDANGAMIGGADAGVSVDPVFSAAQPSFDPQYDITSARFDFGIIDFDKSFNIAYLNPNNDHISIYDLSSTGAAGDFGLEYYNRVYFYQSTGQNFNLGGLDTSSLSFSAHEYLFRYSQRSVVGDSFVYITKFLFRGGKFVDNNDFAYPEVMGAPTAVPEAPTWAMMIFGFGLVGGAMRQKRTRFAKAGLA